MGFSSVVDPGFWMVYGKKKLDVIKLSSSAVRVRGWYGVSRSENVSSEQFRVGGQDLLLGAWEGDDHDRNLWRGHGLLYNLNTVEDFKQFDKKALAVSDCDEFRRLVSSGEIEKDPSLLVRFFVLSYADLKRHRFLYWFCFSAIVRSQVVEIGGLDSLELGGQVLNSMFVDRDSRVVCGFYGVLDNGQRLVPLDQVDKARLTCLLFIDPGCDGKSAGWPIHNFSYWAFRRLGVKKVRVACIRRSYEASIVVECTECDQENIRGWEANPSGKLGPRLMDLSAQMDPEKLANSACDLNLKLMRWRALPHLDTEKLKATSCLLVGSGTLGCSVARCLLGWGFRKLTMLDNGRVSYSNPVRQSLFTFEDCKNGGKPKAAAAAEALKSILPGLDVEGVDLTIPMPGHFVTAATQQQTRKDVETLRALIERHDVVMLLTDTRESRWLPTLLGAKYNKLVLNAALGFDSYMVMRHGAGPQQQEQRLGCYFCNDVVAPQNSMKDRTLDQQCTVTRPGLAPIAGAVLVELLVGLLHHEMGNQAPAGGSVETLGSLPHQVRGFLPMYESSKVSGAAFPQCTACSQKVVETLDESGFEFLERVFNEPNYLEDLTGLTLLRNNAMIDDLLMDDFDDFDQDEGGLL
uniref:Ubiquitin-like modifier-activating enzyme ATG7 n=1 Tax=Mucochytrium quahogii TaxID=96639 RepID=A0A7S2SPL1_9STRA|mmetsp:Transcript_8458/g.13725  ORF Transcript_8458/g.13725 Transcript_8458/m.13725 type:complete len:633 (-) Transcript_8458:65-1963(-)|eukprot:CAMPEP_0203747824 /NCGR_PEP_ID=MMETSP0098-20131031/2870_1 /ASSEMBLY_ACC=CAM_ASM_000208 /TAXON_ID=96639 /ORGANISM=" , Strain NY0313808BC1" /LENGTH=632 /DNA_ID=CAMNT_0050636385 /DNA_START=369 /DNA_END=2267 /DNA_ORIENTATION=+